MIEKLNIKKLASEILFVESPDLYPESIWVDFQEALYAMLDDEDLSILECWYGRRESNLPKSILRKNLLKTVSEIKESAIFNEMLLTLGGFDVENFVENHDKEKTESETILGLFGLNTSPFQINGISFDSTIDGSPVYIWKFSSLKMPFWLIRQITEVLAEAGYSSLILIADPKLIGNISASNLHVSINVIPLTVGMKKPDHVIGSEHYIENDSPFVS